MCLDAKNRSGVSTTSDADSGSLQVKDSWEEGCRSGMNNVFFVHVSALGSCQGRILAQVGIWSDSA